MSGQTFLGALGSLRQARMNHDVAEMELRDVQNRYEKTLDEIGVSALGDRELALAWKEVFAPQVATELRSRLPLVPAIGRTAGIDVDGLVLRFSPEEVRENPRRVSNAIVDAKTRFGAVDTYMHVGIGLREELGFFRVSAEDTEDDVIERLQRRFA